MKIAIQGHPTRGHEVIQILESLGGKKFYYSNAFDKYLVFFIDDKGYISCFHHESPLVKDCFKIYTLEEFEKEFPFKIGDRVTVVSNIPYKVVAFGYFMGRLCYELNNGLYYNSEVLTLYKEMKEERNIKLTLDKAKEWYKKGGELKEIALQAFTEKELTKVDLPKTWEEFCNNYPIKEGESYAGDSSEIYTHCKSNGERDSELDRNMCPTPKSAEAHLALIQLEQLRDCYRGLFVTVIGMPVWCIRRRRGELIIEQRVWGTNETFLSFQSKEVAGEYLKNFKPLIEKAGDLI